MSSSTKNPIRYLIGFGFWVQGLRCFPWMAVSFFLKDGLKVDPSTLQLLQNSANFPMIGKPLYGVVSDAVYIGGQHRIPYIVFGALLQAFSWLSIALLPLSSISLFTVTIFLLLGNLGASIVEVANDAIVAETGKEANSSSKKQKPSSSSGELQSFAAVAGSVGGLVGNLIGGVAIERFTTQTMFLTFGLILSIQFLLTITISEKSLNLPRSSSSTGIRKQLLELTVALKKPEIMYSILWFAASFAVIPVLIGTMFFYQTQHLKLDSSVLGISKVVGQAALLVWSVIYNKRLKSISPRKLIASVQATMAVFMLSDVLFVIGMYNKMGIPDSVYVVIFSGVAEVLFMFKVLPFSVLIAQLCPPGCEGSLMAFLMSTMALASIVSGYLGVALASYVGVSGNDFSGLPRAIIIQAVCTVLPLFWSSWIPDNIKPKKNV